MIMIQTSNRVRVRAVDLLSAWNGVVFLFLQLLEGVELHVGLFHLIPDFTELFEQTHGPRLIAAQQDLHLLLHLRRTLGLCGHVTSVDLSTTHEVRGRVTHFNNESACGLFNHNSV